MAYQMCARCVMDNRSDETIFFDNQGYCNYCSTAIESMPQRYFPNEEGQRRLGELIREIKEKGKGKKYDCLMGISGGLDSAYLAYLGHQHNLRILAIHVDDGFDTPAARTNIEKLSEACAIDVVQEQVDREQYFALVKAFLRAGVPNLAIPQDNLIFAYLYKYAKEYDVRYFLSGGNFALESILQRGNTHSAYDRRHIIDINSKFGTTGLEKLRLTSNFERKIKDQLLLRIKEYRPLNYIDYNKQTVIAELEQFCGYDYYGGKHYESILTLFMQKYYLPRKFSVDKRHSHLSSLIVSGQLSREDALQILSEPLYGEEVELIITDFLNLIDLSRTEFEQIMNSPPKQHNDFKTSYWKYVSKLARRFRGF